MGRLDGKVALISGAARGVGECHARVVVGDVLGDLGRAVVDGLGDRARYVRLDVRSEHDWERAVGSFGELDVLVNNAGIVRVGTMESTSLADFVAMFEVKQLGVLLGMQAAVQSMRRAGGGSIINISSESGMVGKRGLLGCWATKWAVRGMTKSAARDLGALGIRVNSVYPGGVPTPFVMSDQFAEVDPADVYGSQPIPRSARRREISPLLVYLASDANSYATGSEFLIDGETISGNDIAIREDATVKREA